MPDVLLAGLGFGESPRWHDGRLWFSDMGTNELSAVDTAGDREVIATIPGMPMGSGWLPEPDGRMLIVSCRDGKLLRREPDGLLVLCCDLAGLDPHPWGDMAVDGRGNAYIGNIGFDFPGGAPAPGILALVTPGGTARQVANGLQFPNGIAITPDNRTLIVAESYASRLTAYDIAADGTLSRRRVWAELDNAAPDGICLDADGAVWVADPIGARVFRVREGGQVTDSIAYGDVIPVACVLGGPDRRTLLICVAADWRADALAGRRTGRIDAHDVAVPGAGRP